MAVAVEHVAATRVWGRGGGGGGQTQGGAVAVEHVAATGSRVAQRGREGLKEGRRRGSLLLARCMAGANDDRTTSAPVVETAINHCPQPLFKHCLLHCTRAGKELQIQRR